MELTILFLFLYQLNILEWKTLGWAFAIFSGFGAKIAFEVAEKNRKGEKITKSYWVEIGCGIFITFVIGFHSRSIIRGFSDNPDVQAGMYALVGVLGFALFKILYRIITNPKLWEKIVDAFVNAFLSKYTKRNQVDPKEINDGDSTNP